MRRGIAYSLVALMLPALASAQQMERVTFDEAIRRAVTNNPTIQQAAIAVIRAESILQQVASQSRPALSATFTTNVIDPVTRFSGSSIFPRAQTVTAGELIVPLLRPVDWAERNQAADQVFVSQQSAAEARREIATAAAEAYLSVIALRRVLELNEGARDNAKAHYDYANQRFEGGIGSRLNAVRAQQELSADETRVEAARLAIRRAQEALGVLIASDAPVDAAADPTFDVPAPSTSDQELVSNREDVRVIIARQSAAERVSADSWKDNLPSMTALFGPQLLAPAGLFANARSLRASLLLAVPLFDSGLRKGRARERAALAELVRSERSNAERQAQSEIRTAREAISATERALVYARLSAEQANEVVRITDVAFREGATTNIEVIDAQRRARDAATASAIAEDAVRRARLDLLLATGRFPQ